jgi:hypothetical protein
MGGLNANLILQAGQPLATPVNSFGQMYAQAQQAKQQKLMQTAALQEQQQEQQLKQVQLQNAQATQVQQQGVLQALQGTNGDVNAAIELLKKQGNPQAFVLEKHKADAEKATAELGDIQQKVAGQKAKLQADNLGHVASLVTSLDSTPDALKPIKYAGARQVAISNGWATPDQLPEQWNDQTAQQVQALGQSAITAKDQLQMRLDQGKAAETTRHNLTTEQQGQVNSDLTKQRDLNTAQNQLIERLQRDKQLGIENSRLGLEAKRVGLESARVGLEGQRIKQTAVEGDPMSALNAGELKQAQMIASGDAKKLPQGARNGRNSLINQAAYQLAAQNGTDLTDELYTTKQDFLSSKGQANQRLKSITRVMGHLEDFDQNNAKLGTSILDAVGIHGATTKQVALGKDVTAIAEEWKTLIKGNASLEAHKELLDGLKSPYPQVRQGAANEIKRLMSEQFRGDYQSFKSGTGQELPVDRLFDQTTKQRLAKSGYLPGQMNPQQGSPQGGGVPAVGGSFNGEKVLKVTRVK